jgi:pyruvate/2-oxoacid:ferredoxin oxidoreductase alpha subunit
MVYGASAAGMRVMTSSSSPGISLKAEGLSYIAGSDIPALVVNVQRGGPGLGGIQPSQSDYFQATKGGGHGDFRMIVLAPASVQEMASLTIKGFDLADKYLMTAMILADGTIGQMMEPITFEDEEIKKYDYKCNFISIDDCILSGYKGSVLKQTIVLNGFKYLQYQYIVKKEDNTTFIITVDMDNSNYESQEDTIKEILSSLIIK